MRASSALEHRPQSPLDSPTLCSTPQDSLCSLSSSNMIGPTHQRTTSGGGGESSSYSTTTHQPPHHTSHLLENNTGGWRSSAAIAAAEDEINRRQGHHRGGGGGLGDTAIYSLRDEHSYNLLRELNKQIPSAAHYSLGGIGGGPVLGAGATSGPHSLPRTHSKSYAHGGVGFHHGSHLLHHSGVGGGGPGSGGGREGGGGRHHTRKRLRRSNSVSDLTRRPYYDLVAKLEHEHSTTGNQVKGRAQLQHQHSHPLSSSHYHSSHHGHGHGHLTGPVSSSHKRRSLPKKPPAGSSVPPLRSSGQIPQIRIDAACAGGGITTIPVGPMTQQQQHKGGLGGPYGQQQPLYPLFLAGTTLLSSSGLPYVVPTGQQQQYLQQTHHLGGAGGGIMGAGPSSMTIPGILTTGHQQALGLPHTQQQQHQLLNGRHYRGGTGPYGDHQSLDTNNVDVLDIPGHGRCFVYIARYSYDPFQQSPNENPESELYLSAGDYLLIWGRMDEDGYLDGQLLDGRRGLVPSNYVERLYGEDLIEFYQQAVLGIRNNMDADALATYPSGLEDESQRLVYEDLMHRRHDELSYLDLEDVIEDEDLEKQVPCPQHLTLERQLNKSILISWSHPDCAPGTIESYQVYVNGLLRCTIKALERTRALVEGVDANRPHRISVRAVTSTRRTSRDAACTMVIGKGAPLAPSCVRATHITSTSAIISWLPSNSNYQHVVSVNNVEVRTVKPGVYRHTISVLSPNTSYRVTVRSKNIRSPLCDEKNIKQMDRLSSYTEFRTLPKGLPDPPLDVQVEAGPQDNTLLVTWHPVTAGTSNGAIVTGYAVFADGRKVLEIDSPSGDHALLDLNRFQGVIPKHVTVRTKSHDSLSSDSIPIAIPAQVIGKVQGRRHNRMMGNSLSRRRQGSSIEGDESFSDHDMGIGPPNQYSAGGYGRNPNIPSIDITSDTDTRLYHGGGSGRLTSHGPYSSPQQHYLPQHPDRPMTARGYHNLPPQRGGYRGGPQQQPMMDEYQQRDQYQQQQQHGRMPPPMGGGPYGGPGGRRGGGRMGPGPQPGGPGSMGGMGMGPGQQRGGPQMRMPPEQRYRLFVALFDYDPPSMSPNPDACDEELPFREGQMIKIYGDKDADGFYWGEAGGRQGYVPCNMVSEMHADDERAAQELLNQEQGVEGPVSGRERRAMGRERWGDIYANMPMKKMVSLYDYDPQELSPNVDSEVELSFRTGDIIYVYGDMDDDGFYMGELNGVRGLVPSNFLTEAPADYGDRGGPGGGGGPSGMQRRGGPPHLGPPDHRRPPPGPGARGPPPPPPKGPPSREPPPGPRGGVMEGRRKDASFPSALDMSEHPQQYQQQQQPQDLRNHYDGAVGARRGGRGGGIGMGGGGPMNAMMGVGRGGGGLIGSQYNPQQHGQPQHQQQLQQGDPGRRNLRGIPTVVPQFSPMSEPSLQQQAPTQQQPPHTTSSGGATSLLGSAFSQPLASKLPGVFGGGGDGPNFMQKFSEFTHSATAGGGGAAGDGSGGEGGGLFKTGKELIFKKFGLGG